MVHIEVISDQEAAELYRLQGNNAFRNAQYDEAIFFYGEALQHQKDNATIYTNRAMASLKVDNCMQAEADCNEALRIDPQNAKAFHRRGLAREKLGDLNGAAQDFEQAMKYMDDDSIGKGLAKIKQLIKQRDEEHKLEEHQKIAKKQAEPKVVNIEALRNEAKDLFQAGQFQLAVDKYSVILDQPDLSVETRVTALNNRAACYIQMKFEREAIQDLTELLELDPGNTKARLRRALVFENLEKAQHSYDDYKLVLAMDPSASQKASEGLRRLLQNNPELKSRPTPEIPAFTPKIETRSSSSSSSAQATTPASTSSPTTTGGKGKKKK